MTKKEINGEHPSSHYLVVGDAQKPETWSLRVRGLDGKPDHRLMGAAWAALHGGASCATPYEDKAAVVLRSIYKSEGLIVPDSASDAPFLERRMCVASDMRVNGKRNPVLEGYAAVFNSLSQEMCGFRERIMPGAFTRTLSEKPDVRCLINHDTNLVLGRTIANTLRLAQDENGLTYSADLPDTSYANDLAESIRRGDVSQSSFGFRVAGQDWVTENKMDIRQITEVDLFDVSPVTFPAYTQTRVEIRSFIKFMEGETERAPVAPIVPSWNPSGRLQRACDRLLRLASQGKK
jgi:HK97 family phage prohead protease